ncbi:LysR substrate-binding domain-containing protein [Telmatospirillum sp.]|uniref:LysR substrate-binding domain-containing protein n=1 Tax=Telmatospirillum sp. TaxID=2079197 RepID=UPI002845B180|nr:LysR substrate-binding domain-containing protein [Telmatospirillum sp.]MDR3440549.1 LysR substrate-binding domain-containing protein [Telmatospirillum sp.]
MVSLDLDSLRSFVAVADTSSFSRAGERVGRSQSAVSLQLARLEKILDKILIVRRQGRVLGMTEDGRELLHYARQMIALNDAAYRAVAQSAKLSRVRLGILPDLMTAPLLDSLQAFREHHLGVEIEVVSDIARRLSEQIEAGRLDAILSRQTPSQDRGIVVARQSTVWVKGTDWPPPDPDESLPLVLFPDGCAIRAQIFNTLEEAGRYWRIACSCLSLADIKLAVRKGLGVTALPIDLVDEDRHDLSVLDLPAIGDVELIFTLGRNTGTTTRALVDHIAQNCQTSLVRPPLNGT